jgi:transposase
MRPIFHFKPERIRAHIAICYAAFAILRYTEYQIAITQKVSLKDLVSELVAVQISQLIDRKTQERYILPCRMSQTAIKIYRAFRIQRLINPMKIVK